MVNIQLCDDCIHSKICRIKNGYNEYIKAINKVAITTVDNKIWYVKDCDDVVMDVRCKHYQKPQVTIK